MTMVYFFNVVVVKGDKDKASLSDGDGYIDARDTAAAHVLAGEMEAAGGERIIVKNGMFFKHPGPLQRTLCQLCTHVCAGPFFSQEFST